MAATPTGSVPAPPTREGGSPTWAPTSLDPAALLKAGWTVHSYHDLHERFIVSARSRGTTRTSLETPAKPLLDLLTASSPLAVVGVSLRTPADLRSLYGFIVEPPYRRGLALLIASDRELDELDPGTFVDPVGYPWRRLRRRLRKTCRYAQANLPAMPATRGHQDHRLAEHRRRGVGCMVDQRHLSL